ncbi:MAG: ComF family protein [Candidatus Paceibacterota bacterium]
MNELRKMILDLIFPRRCLGCEILLGDNSESTICPGCLSEITTGYMLRCAFCNLITPNGVTCDLCKPGHSLDQLLVTTSYDNPLVEKIMKTMKYRFVKSLAHDISSLMIDYLHKRLLDKENLTIIPIPLHRLRLNWRGFNQSEVIAERISNHLDLKLLTDAVARKDNNQSQASIPNRASRATNTTGIFKCIKPESVKNKNILLIDDISTTGSTLDECAKELKSAGANRIMGFVFARGLAIL